MRALEEVLVEAREIRKQHSYHWDVMPDSFPEIRRELEEWEAKMIAASNRPLIRETTDILDQLAEVRKLLGRSDPDHSRTEYNAIFTEMRQGQPKRDDPAADLDRGAEISQKCPHCGSEDTWEIDRAFECDRCKMFFEVAASKIPFPLYEPQISQETARELMDVLGDFVRTWDEAEWPILEKTGSLIARVRAALAHARAELEEGKHA